MQEIPKDKAVKIDLDLEKAVLILNTHTPHDPMYPTEWMLQTEGNVPSKLFSGVRNGRVEGTHGRLSLLAANSSGSVGTVLRDVQEGAHVLIVDGSNGKSYEGKCDLISVDVANRDGYFAAVSGAKS